MIVPAGMVTSVVPRFDTNHGTDLLAELWWCDSHALKASLKNAVRKLSAISTSTSWGGPAM